LATCLDGSHSIAHNRGRVANFNATFAERELAVSTLREVKSVKSTLALNYFTPNGLPPIILS
jgi:hypothetical protein